MASAFQGAVTEAFWCCHFERQAASEVSIRADCREHGLAESSFYAWRRKIDWRDAVQNPPSRRVSRARRMTKSPGRTRIRSSRMSATVIPCLVTPAAVVPRERPARSDRLRPSHEGNSCLGSRSDGVGLVAARSVQRKLAPHGMCRELHDHRDWLWTFVEVQGIEPTNNTAERVLRPAVIYRKLSFGTQSEAGSRFIERMLTVSETCHLQKTLGLPVAHRRRRSQPSQPPLITDP